MNDCELFPWTRITINSHLKIMINTQKLSLVSLPPLIVNRKMSNLLHIYIIPSLAYNNVKSAFRVKS